MCSGTNETAGSNKRVIYLLELLNGTLVDTTALVDQVTCNVIVSFCV